jgi:energy-converting hydrogenase B subunit D
MKLAILQDGILLFVAVAGAAVVFTRDTTSQAILVSFYGLLLAILFFVFQAPDVALSQIVVGALALPLMILLALARMKKQEQQKS